MRIIKMLSGKGDTWRRVLALFLACVMLFSIMPVQSFAESAKDMGFTDGTELTDGSDFTDGTEDPAAGTDSTDSTDPADGTNPTDSGDPAEEVLQEETVPKDITNCTDQLTLSMKKWWFETHENAVEANEEKYVDFSGFAQNPEASEWTGVTLQFEAAGVLAGDWFTVVFSRQFSDVQIEDGYIFPEEIESALKETEQGTELTVRFSAAGALAGELPLKFKMSASEKISMLLQQDVNNKNEYMVIPPAVEPEELLSAAVLPESGEPEEEILSANVLAESDEPEEENLSENDLPESGESEEELFSMTDLPEAGQSEQGISLLGNDEPDTGTFSIRGEIVFDEKLEDGTDWRSILRPLEFDQEIKLIATYQDADNNVYTVEYHAQDNLPQDPFYMMMTHDGEGGGSFEIVNVPKQLTLDDGTKVTVTKYNVSVDEKYPYYKNENDGFNVTDMGATQTVSTLKLTLKSQKLTLDPKVVGDQTEAAFPMNVTFTNPCGAEAEKSALSKTMKPTNTQKATIEVPVGIDFQVVQSGVDGYKLDSEYTVTTQTGELKSESTQTGKAIGKIEEGTNVTVSTINYMQNITYPFTVTWVDNNASDRPTLGQGNFKLQYQASTKNENGETVWETDGSGKPVWRELTAEKDTLDFLGIDKLPTFDVTGADRGQYVYRGLPSVDKYGNSLSYHVESGNLSGYTVSANDNYNEFTYRQTTSFNAAISWLDSDNADRKRPDNLPLKLYRRAANENYEAVVADLTVTKNGNTWSVSADGLPRYNDSNQEYDYVIVQGTIGENNTVTQTEIDFYRTDYNNGTGNFGNDIALCHNGGTISQRITGEVDFKATKNWKDNVTNITQRPETTVTLWRYSVPNEGNHSIDTMYNAGQAAQVIYRETTGKDGYGNPTYKDILLAYNLSKTNPEAITFDHSTVPDLPVDFKLPAYDEQGRRYVYFVRETVDSQNYEISYASNNSEAYENGAPNNGTITNTRREKSAVNVTKVWQCPSNLPDIEDTSIQMKILAPDPDQEGNYEELTVYSAALNSFEKLTGDDKTTAQTLSGFKENIATLDLQFYVNIYDENGLPYDMTQAVIQEIKVLDKNNQEISVDYSDDQKKGTGTFTLKENQYTAASTYVKQTELADGMKQFQYKETNTISGVRNYTLIKKWQGFEDTELANYAYVSFKLTRRSSKDGATSEVVKPSGEEEYWKVQNQGGSQWESLLEHLPKYDDQGYEYLYSAEEVSVTNTTGQTVSGWSSYHYRTENSTTVTNYIGTGGGSDVLFVTKTWMDNGDTDARKWVKVRIYRKSDVREALNSKGDGDVISLDNLGIGYAEYDINLAGLTEMTLSDVENKIVANSEGSAQNLTVKDYIILEYKVNSGTGGETAATYTVSQLKAAVNNSSTTVSGKVSNSQRQYETLVERENDRLVTITNTRTGEASLEVTKNWLDEENAGGKRPDSVKFQVYQDGQEYKPGADSGIGSITPATGNVSAVWDPSAGTITVTPDAGTNTAESWFFRLENLPLFSETGVPHTYNVEEIDEATSPNGGKSQTGTFSYYLSTKGETTVTENQVTPDLVTYQFSFTNTLTGTTVHSAHKTWNDRDSGGFDRPDLYLTLWRYLKSDAKNHSGISVEKLNSYDQYTDCEDPVWTVIDAYHWRADVTGLPLYNENGQEYVYRFQETLNNNGVTVYGTYRQEAEYGVTSQCNTCAKLNSSYTTPYDQFINTLTDVMTVSGVKTWTGFGGYQIDQKDYPKVTIELYRSLDPTINPLNKKDTDTEFKTWLDNGSIEKVNRTVTLKYDEASKTYPTTYSFGTGEEEPLPKFNEEGRRWYYSVREVLPDALTDSLYTERFANGTLTNEFLTDVNRRSIKVTKTWVRENLLQNEKNKYPSVTYYLYRYEEGKTAPSQPLKTVTINASEFENSNNGQYTYTFTNLLIYSPSGKPYRYYIKEKAINGYTVSYTDESGIDSSYSRNEQSDVISVPNDIKNPSTVEVGTTNNYSDPGQMKITGQKYWNDYGNSNLIYGKRPESIDVTLKRYTQNEWGQKNAITEEIIDLKTGTEGSPKIEWKVSKTDPNYWNYTIYNLERYAPNGMPYIYTVTETPVDGYRQSNGPVEGTAGTTGDLALSVLTNSLGATYYVRKNWMDGNNKYGLRPTRITVVLQRSIDGKDWQNIQWKSGFGSYDAETGKWTGLPSVTTDENGKDIVSITLTSANEIANTRHNSWQYTFTNLPEKDASGNPWKYRCIETKIDNADVKPVEGKTNTFTAGAYTCTYPTQDDTKTVIQNKLESTSLYVKKNWKGDQNDLYHSRPESLTFVLQMRGIKKVDASSEGGSTEGGNTEGGSTEGEFELTNWQNVKVNGSDYTFTLSPDKWETVLQDLPVAVVAPDGTTYYTLYFRAVELHADDTRDENGNITSLGTKVLGALNYEDKTNYSKDYDPNAAYNGENPLPDHYYDTTLNRNESQITNELILDKPAKSITVTKNWKRQQGESVTATFELLYKTAEEGADSWHCFGGQSVGNTWTGHTHDKGCVLKTDTATGTVENTLTWKDLPMYDRAGKILEYKVVEHPVTGYKTEEGSDYTFTNIELQSYTVKKIWQNTDYAEKATDGFTAEFKLQQKIGNGAWEDAKGESGNVKTCTLTSTSANDTQSHTWTNLPKYTTDGKEITYRAVETNINGKSVDENTNTNGSYIVTYQYGKDSALKNDSTFADTQTEATNRMVYGFVNLSKAAAYLAPGVTADSDKNLKGVVFDIYAGTGDSKTLYASGVTTDANGNLIRNDDETYGTEKKHLISGTYTLMEKSSNPGYSVWKNGVTFVVGTKGGTTDTGEHGTAWISTETAFNNTVVLKLKTEYKHSSESNHTFANSENCAPVTNGDNAYNLESRGVIQFTKTGPNGAVLDTHANATGESKAYFGVYTNDGCTNQVAGMMADTDRKTMVLTTLDKDGTDKETEFCNIKNSAQIPYLRKSTDGLLTLLSGTYYLKELVAPPGYKLDNTVRKVVVPQIAVTELETDLTGIYGNNKADIMLVNEGIGTNAYNWFNTENQLTLYKRDQYGRPVSLGDKWLELSVASGTGENNTFLTGEKTIRLYQDTAKPATKADDSGFDAGSKPDITYDSTNGCWTIKGLFDIGKTYTLSEPADNVPANNIKAKDFVFTMGADGKITVSSVDAISNENPLAVAGNDYENYYKSDSGNNIVVLRDTARYLTDVALKKIDFKYGTSIENISFELYKKTGTNTEGAEVYTSVLEEGSYLTTNATGVIKLSDTNGYINKITACDLKYGLDVGKYYFQEIERGASDTYRLLDKIFFEIKPKHPGNTTNYEDYATVEFETTENGPVSQTSGDHSATVKNTPVTEKPKTLELTKVDSENAEIKLQGAQFTLTYTSVNNGTTGSYVTTTYYCITDNSGVLYLRENNTSNGSISSKKPDISKKGTYVLVETQAPDDYMTRTENGTTNPVTMVSFEVDSNNQITNVQYYNGQGDLVEGNVNSSQGEHIALNLTVKNEKTVVSIAKRNDIERGTKTSDQKKLGGEPLSGAKLEIYEGVYNENSSPLPTPVTTWTSDAGGNWSVEVGKLKENTIYTLHESQAPVGYLPANDIYFKLFGTTMKTVTDENGNPAAKIVSQLYVWTGEGTPTDVTGTGWLKSSSIKDTVLTMVDEAIIAPVDLQKVVGPYTSNPNYKALPGAEFEVKSLDDNTILGTAITDSTGHLVWKSINANAYEKGLIFNDSRKRVTVDDKDSVISHTIILRQNSSGYQFTEIYAPDNAYNKGESFTVKITAENYTDYRDGGYQANVYVDILAANNATGKMVTELTTRENTPANTDLINPPFEAAFELYKYDAEHPDINSTHNNYAAIGLPGVTFTLYKKQTDGNYPKTGTTYTTGANGLLHINLTEKGTYKLVETTPLAGYNCSSKAMEFTIVNEDYKKTVTYSETGENHTVAVKDKNGTAITGTAVYDLPNSRIHGTVTLTKQDADSGVELNGVQYTLTRTDPSSVNDKVDKWFPKGQNSIIVETGKTYTVVATAVDETAFTAGIIDTGDSAPGVGVLSIKDLQWGTYTLTEKQENDGYILETKPFTFTIDANGLNPKVTDTGKEFVSNTKNQLTIHKTDLGGNNLSGARFQLYPVTGTVGSETMSNTPAGFYSNSGDAQMATEKTITIGATGETTIYGLRKGTYVLREIKAPDGYELTKDVIFTMSADGQVSAVTTCRVEADNKISRDASGDAVVTFTTSGTGTAITNTLTVKDTPIEVRLSKAVSDGTLTSARGEASYNITGIFARETEQQTRTFIGNTITEALKAQLIGGNSYIITETAAPAGYEVQKKSATIQVAPDGKIEVTEGKTFLSVVNESDGTAALTFTDDPIELTLSKVDATGGAIDETTLGYAEFSITGKFVSKDGNNIEDDETIANLTTTNFKSELSKRLIGDEIYLVTETAAPNGYKVADPFYIQVDKYGEIIKRGTDKNNMESVNPVTDTLVVQDEPTVISFKKVDDNGPLAGAKFTLTAENNALVPAFVNMSGTGPTGVTKWTSTEIAWTSTESEDGITFINHLIVGVRYKLHEQRVLYHEVMVNDIIFHLEPNGTVKIDTNSSIPNNGSVDAASVSESGIVMTIQNPIVKGMVTLTKTGKNITGTDTDPLEGAVYTLTMTKDANDNVVSDGSVRTDEHNVYQESGGTKSEFTTDSNGKIVITGLPEGYYQFKEIGAPKAYHYNDSPEAEFHISYATGANVSVSYENSRINAKLKLTKYSGSSPLKDAVFDVSYSENENGTYRSIAKITTNTNGEAVLEKGIYTEGGNEEGLWRGFYRLTELSADGQMLNTENGTRNTITFEIGNEINKEYAVKDGTEYTVGGSFITLNENGVVDTPIPTKSVTVIKNWANDNGLDKTFRPDSIQVKLYRSYNGGTPVEVENPIQILNATNNWSYTWDNLPAYVNDGTGDEKTTYLYTYTVKEINGKNWYTVTYSDVTSETTIQDPKVKDGNTNSTVTNTLSILGTTASDKKMLTIKKTLGGGSDADAFKVRIILKKDGFPIGNNSNGYYLDDAKVYNTQGKNIRTETPDSTNGWMTIKGGESIQVELPEGVEYEVEEETTTSGTVAGTTNTNLTYTPRYDFNKKGTIRTKDVTTTIRNAVHKSLNLLKNNESSTLLKDAEFEITYTPLAGSSYVGEGYTKRFTTNANGKLLDSGGQPIDLTNQGTYTIKETKAPAGYITPTDNEGNPIVLATIEVDKNDEMKVTTDYAALVNVEVINNGSQASVTVKNEKTRARIGKTIDYANGTALVGAKLEIYDSTKTRVYGEWDTGSDPQEIPVDKLKEGVVYRLHEVNNSAPVGYLEAEDVYFKLDGTYTYTNGERYSRIVMTDNQGNVMQNQNTAGDSYGDPGVVDGVLKLVDKTIQVPVTLKKVLKVDSNNSPLKDVIFTVTNKNTNEVMGTAITGADGFLFWEKTENGHNAGEEIVLQQNIGGYTFKETFAPAHVYNNGQEFTINPTDQNFNEYLNNKDLKLNIKTGNMENKESGFADGTGTVENLPYKSTVTLYKYDKDNNTQPIKGAQFTLYHATVDENNVWTKGVAVEDAYVTGATIPQTNGVFTTGNDGNLSIEIHSKGYYILEETAAAPGYKLQNPPSFNFELIDGTSAEVASKKEFCYNGTAILKAPGDTRGVPNEMIYLSLTKVDYDTKAYLEDVTFTLKPAEGSSFLSGYSAIKPDGSVELKTDTNGFVDIPKGLVQQNNFYILTETDLGSNTSYRLAENETDRQITFRVEKNGTITITSPNDMFKLAQDAQGNVDATALVVSNQQITLDVSKLNQATGEKLAGVTLQLSRQDTNNNWNPVVLSSVTNNQGQWTTNANAVTFKGNEFTPGTYMLKEITTPNGYNSITGPLIFTIDQSGKVTSAHVESTSDIPLVSEGNEPGKLKAENFTITNPADGKNGVITLKVDNAAYSDLQITKKGSDGTFLKDVEFRLDYKDGTDWKYVKLNSNGKVEVTDHALTPGTAEEAKCATDYNGVVTFSGLPNGKYRLTELKTAQGYNLLSAPLEIEIDRNGEIYKVSYNGGTAQNLTRQNNTLLLTVINQKGFVLPATGTTTPELPKAVLGLAALIEGLVLYKYQSRGKRRKRKG